MPLNLKLQEQLVKMRHDSEEREAKRLAERIKLKYVDITAAPVNVEALKLIPEEKAREHKVAALSLTNKKIELAALQPDEAKTKALIQDLEKQGYIVDAFIASRNGLEHVWDFYKFTPKDKAPITSRVTIKKERILALRKELTSIEKVAQAITGFDYTNFSVTDFLEVVLSGALANRASDIHFEPEEGNVKLRYRIDGILHDIVKDVAEGTYRSIGSRVKLLSNLKINVSDRPQDGRFTIGLAVKDVEVRVAIAPAEYGEIIVMRVLDPDAINLKLSDLGLRADDQEIVEAELERPNGMILNTGPTGSGKTTTLYAFLKAKHTPEIKIITIEDPIEYHLEGIEQTQVDEDAEYSFASGLKSIMRQDPDVILIGEVRDKNTAEVAIQAALTGHLVFSTIHANNAAGAVPRFLDLGVRPTSIGPALNLIIGQRLVRKLCPTCREPMKLTSSQEEAIKKFIINLPKRVERKIMEEITLFSARGCKECNGAGYRGRVGIFELLLNDPHYEKITKDPTHDKLASEAGFEELILGQAGESKILKYALKAGMVTMQDDGIIKAISGVTTLEEIEEITGKILWYPTT